MEDFKELTIEDVRQYFISAGGKVKNQDLVRHFKKFFLNGDPEKQVEARNQFKDYVNTLATVKLIEGIKYLTLKKKYWEIKICDEEFDKSSSSLENLSGLKSPQMYSVKHQGSPASDDGGSRKHQKKVEKMSPDLSRASSSSPEMLGSLQSPHSQSSPSILEAVMLSAVRAVSEPPLGTQVPCHVVSSPVELPSSPISRPQNMDMPPNQPPKPPPRRKSHGRGKENRGAKIEERVKQFSEDGQLAQESPKEKNLSDLTVSPGSVKERAQKLNKMASESDLTFKLTPVSGLTTTGKKRENRGSDYDDSSVNTLDPRRREWILKAAQADYHSLIRLLKEEPKLAFFRTALHWAAKHGNADIIKLIAGVHQVDTNIRTGYTALHIAAMAGHEGIMELLTSTYDADPCIRDYSGRKPHQYLAKWQNLHKSTGTLSKMADKDLSFMRIGSLNSRVKKTAAALTGGRGVTRLKSWGSADNLSELLERQMMPPPKYGPLKKKKVKKVNNSEFYSTTSDKAKSGDSDSDSAYGFYS
ncbi:ankyrin repeat domain-containing protein SOWAHC-like isoform X2 [Tachypleus tridentatus]|uniref:ankyrin repeat domain-containing protein SOWAHC-like isoform X2 n=1 Tax=Tachypleus tridentatus TaxID=6853 RepID=UPI003FD525ED